MRLRLHHPRRGYRNNKAERTIEVDPVDSPMLKRMMELYATGSHTLSTLRKMLKDDFGKVMSKANVHRALQNRFYIGYFMWGGQEYPGTHQLVVDPGVFSRVQQVLAGHNRPHPQKREIAFRGLMNCAHDGCMLTGDVQKEKYVYYRCSASRGKCDLPRFREQTIAERLGEPLRGLRVPEEIVAQIVNALSDSDREASQKVEADRKRLDGRLKAIQTRMDAAYNDKLDGTIAEDFWSRKMEGWRTEERGVQQALTELAVPATGERALYAQRVFELANRAYSLYVSQDPTEQAKLLKMMCSNFAVDDVSATPSFRYPFDRIFERAKLEEWSGRLDSN